MLPRGGSCRIASIRGFGVRIPNVELPYFLLNPDANIRWNLGNKRRAERLRQVHKAETRTLARGTGQRRKEAKSLNDSISSNAESETANPRSGTLECTARRSPCFNDLGPAGILDLMRQYEIAARQAHLLGSPRVDQLLTLIQFNVFRALISNTATIGFTMAWLQEDAISPWNSTCKTASSSCPTSLRPTLAQQTIEHHPWVDLFPIPRMRDNMLLAGDTYDEYELCNDLVDFCDVPSERTGLVVWGEPHDPAGWEVTESFLQRWGWVVKGCVELLISTNHWRKQRGEDELVFEL